MCSITLSNSCKSFVLENVFCKSFDLVDVFLKKDIRHKNTASSEGKCLNKNLILIS